MDLIHWCCSNLPVNTCLFSVFNFPEDKPRQHKSSFRVQGFKIQSMVLCQTEIQNQTVNTNRRQNRNEKGPRWSGGMKKRLSWETASATGCEEPWEELQGEGQLIWALEGGLALERWGGRLRERFLLGFPGGSVSKESTCNKGDPGSIPGWGRSPGEGNGNPLQYPCLEDPGDRGVWWATVRGVAKSQTTEWLTLSHFLLGRQNPNLLGLVKLEG